MYKSLQIRGIGFAGLAVILGAFGAHGLKAVLSVSSLATFETGVKYQFMHALALILLSIMVSNQMQSPTASTSSLSSTLKGLRNAGLFFTIGICLFSGSLYLLAIQTILPFQLGAWMGPITPIGGFFFILGWVNWGIAIARG